MRQILVDYARRRSAAKRGPQYKLELVATSISLSSNLLTTRFLTPSLQEW